MTKRDTIEAKLFHLGLGNRRECKGFVRDGLVSIDGEVVEDCFAPFPADAKKLEVNGEVVDTETNILAVLHKPEGYECSHHPTDHASVYELLPPRWMNMDVNTAGRLDVDTSGVLIFSNDGDFIHHLESPRKQLPKTYEFSTWDPFTDQQFSLLRKGVNLKGEKGVFAPVSLERIEDGWVRMQIREGKYHQVKRMVAAVGNKVSALRRVAVGDLALTADWEPGTWRMLTAADLRALQWERK